MQKGAEVNNSRLSLEKHFTINDKSDALSKAVNTYLIKSLTFQRNSL